MQPRLEQPRGRRALRLLDAVLRRGEPLELALHGAAQGLPQSDRALVHAIAAEVLRHLTDLDALIDGATRQALPGDAKARMVLRIALAQTLALGTPAHAAIATALPLVDGGPRKLVHGVFGTVTRSDPVLPDPPTLPVEVAARWTAQWGEAMALAAAAAYGQRPPVDVSLRDARETVKWTELLGGASLAPGHVRLPDSAVIPELPGFSEGAWWVQDVAASCAARLRSMVWASSPSLSSTAPCNSASPSWPRADFSASCFRLSTAAGRRVIAARYGSRYGSAPVSK